MAAHQPADPSLPVAADSVWASLLSAHLTIGAGARCAEVTTVTRTEGENPVLPRCPVTVGDGLESQP